MCYRGDSISKTKCFIIGLIVAGVLFSFGIALAYLGENAYRLSTCKTEPALALWMMTAGVSLLLNTTVVFIVLVARTSNKVSQEDSGRNNDNNFYCLPNLARKSMLVLGWAFCCGIFMVLWYMINFSLWIAGTYLAIITIQKMRQIQDPEAGQQDDDDGCPLSCIGMASTSVILVWTVFFALCCRFVYRICDNSVIREQVAAAAAEEDFEALAMFDTRPRRRSPPPPRLGGNTYDEVATSS